MVNAISKPSDIVISGLRDVFTKFNDF